MIRSILVLTIRNFFRNFNYSVLTLSGLVLGITTGLLTFSLLYFEFTYDRQNPAANRIFTILMHELFDGTIHTSEDSTVPLADFLRQEVPEIEYMTRLDNEFVELKYNDVAVEKDGTYADSSYFNVFPAKIVEGNPDKALQSKNAVALSSRLSKILFPDGKAAGKFVSIGRQEYQVSAVYEAYPANNSMQYVSFVLPYDARKSPADVPQHYFVKLIAQEKQAVVEDKLNQKLKQFYQNDNVKATLFCLTDWRLHGNFENGQATGGRIVYVVSFGFIGLFILIMACVNYMNMATARATRRAREIGVRKMTGATQRMLVRQFITESLFISAVAAAIAALCAALLLPLFRELTGLAVTIDWSDPVLLSGFVLITALTGILAGSYPAFLLSSFRPAVVLKGSMFTSMTGSGIRRGLVVFQFILSIVFVFGALVMWKQTSFLLNKDVGYDKHNVINVWLASPDLPIQSFRTEVAKHSAVVSVSYGGASPMEVNGAAEVKWPGKAPGEVALYGATADFDMIPTLGLKIIQGRNFSRDLITDSANYIINQRAAELLGFKNPIGQRITYTMYGDREGEIIGVINDFQNDDIHLPMAPVIFGIGRQRSEITNMFIRYQPGRLEEALNHLKATYKKFTTSALNYSLLDKDYEGQLYREIVIRRLSMIFTAIAILIAILGLMGLALFNAERRTKEIGIRKVLGASVAQVLQLMYKEYVRPTAISLVIALPLAYYLMRQYLEGFSYRISLHGGFFIATSVGLILLVLLIVSAQSYKAAVKNPAESLKVE